MRRRRRDFEPLEIPLERLIERGEGNFVQFFILKTLHYQFFLFPLNHLLEPYGIGFWQNKTGFLYGIFVLHLP
jgi:hypothetical protein